MKQVTINLYHIDELTKEARQSAFEEYRFYNVKDTWWYQVEYEDFKSICETMGITIPKDGISFRGFYSQGDGSAFESFIDIIKLTEGMETKAWKGIAANLELHVGPCPCWGDALKLIKSGEIDAYISTSVSTRGYFSVYESRYEFDDPEHPDRESLECELEELDKWAKDILDKLNDHLYRSLEREYEYQISDQSLQDYFKENEHLFTQDGRMANWLLGISIA